MELLIFWLGWSLNFLLLFFVISRSSNATWNDLLKRDEPSHIYDPETGKVKRK